MTELSNAELARGLNVAPSIITLWSRRDPPIPRASIDAARRWRQTYAPERGKRAARMAQVEQEKPKTTTTTTAPAPATDTSWKARLTRAREVELQIYDTLQKSLGTGDLISLQRLQTCHVAACKEIANIELVALEVQQASEELIPIDEAKIIFSGVFTPIRQALDRLPSVLAHRVNPDHPDLAREILEEFVERTLAIGRREAGKFAESMSSNVALPDSTATS